MGSVDRVPATGPEIVAEQMLIAFLTGFDRRIIGAGMDESGVIGATGHGFAIMLVSRPIF